jgi:hypothetical protein
MNIKGEFSGIKWIGFDRHREGRRRELILKYRAPDSDWRPVTAPKEVTSETKFRAWARTVLTDIVELGERPIASRSDGEPTIADRADEWIELRRQDPDVAGSTFRDNRSNINHYVVPRWGSLTFLELADKLAELRAWVRELAGKLSPGRVSSIVSTLRMLVRDARLEKWTRLRSNPLNSDEVLTVMPSLGQKRDIVHLPPDVAQSLLDRTKTERRRIRYAVALNTGAGDGEIAGCIIGSVLAIDGDSAALEIVQAFKRRSKEDGKGSELGKTKNAYRLRAIPLNACAKAALKYWVSEGWEKWVGRPPTPSDPLFPNIDGQFSRPNSASHLKADLEDCGLPSSDLKGRTYEFRCLRRTFSTMLRVAGVDRETREQLMGQRSNTINSEHYTAEVPEHLRAAVQKLPLKWSGLGGANGGALGGGDGKGQVLSMETHPNDRSLQTSDASARPAKSGKRRGKPTLPADAGDVKTARLGNATKEIGAGREAGTAPESATKKRRRGFRKSEAKGTKNQRIGGYRGVSWNRHAGKWEGKIAAGPVGANGKRAKVHLGISDDPVALARAYDEAAVRLLGPGCRLNFEADREDLEAFVVAVAEHAADGAVAELGATK